MKHVAAHVHILRGLRWGWFAAAGLAIAAACSSNSNTPSGHATGTEKGPCYGNGTCNSGLVCLSNLCVAPPDGSAGSAGQDGSAGASGSAGTGATGGSAGADGGDAGPACDPLQQTGCASGQRCTWVTTTQSGDGHLACVADGSVALGGACSTGAPGETTGYDNCKKGLGCAQGWCETLCDASAVNACASGYTCQVYSGLYAPVGSAASVGLCDPTCNPVTQKTTSGAAACGSPNPSSPTLGCYQGSTDFTCTKAGDLNRTQGTTPTSASNGLPYVNGCAPGYMAISKDSTNSGYICTAFCQPGPTSASSPANAAGLVGSGETCPDKGAGGSYECRYWQFNEDHTQPGFPDPYSNTIGFCIDPTKYLYDSNNDGQVDTPFPSCTTLSSTAHNFDATLTDNVYWGCAPVP